MSQEDQTPSQSEPTPEPPKPAAKMVPEKDLLAIKAAREDAEKEIKGLKDKVTELTEAYQTAHNNFLQTQAAKEQLEEQLREGQATKEQVDQLQSELGEKKTQVANLETRLTDQKKEIINKAFGTPMTVLDGKTVEQLDLILETFNATGIKRPPGLDTNGGSQAGAVPTTPIEQCKEEIASLREKQK